MQVKDDVLTKLLQHLCFLTYEYDAKAATAPSDDTMNAVHDTLSSLFGMSNLDLHHLVQFVIHHGEQTEGHPDIPGNQWGSALFDAIKIAWPQSAG